MVNRLRIVKLRVLLLALGSALVLTVPAQAATPTGFLPSSTSWLTEKQGAVFGYAPCGKELCPALWTTADGGETWHQLKPPAVKLPENHNQVKLTVVDAGNMFVSDGDSLLATNNGARTWHSVTLDGLKAPFYIAKVAMAHGRVFAVASSLGNSEADFTQIYAGPAGAQILRPMPGFVATGGVTYGDIAVDNDVVQAYVGAEFNNQQYSYSQDGVNFKAAPAPCPVENFTVLGGVRKDRPIVLCNGSGGSPSPGHMTKQVWVASATGGTYVASNEAPTVGGTQGFGAASPADFTIGAVGGGESFLHSSFDAGRTWATTELSDRGFGMFDLAFVSPKVGFVVDGVPDAGSAVYRTVDAGHTWKELSVSP